MVWMTLGRKRCLKHERSDRQSERLTDRGDAHDTYLPAMLDPPIACIGEQQHPVAALVRHAQSPNGGALQLRQLRNQPAREAFRCVDVETVLQRRRSI